MLITSKENPKLKLVKKLHSKKYRQKEQKFIIENIKTILDAQKQGISPVELYIHEEKVDQYLTEFSQEATAIFTVEKSLFQNISTLEASSGMIAIYKASSKPINTAQSVLYLNGISDPGNLGTLLRTALAFNIENVVLDNDCVDIYNPKVQQAAKNAIFALNIEQDTHFETLRTIKANMPILTSALENGISVESVKKELTPNAPFCLVLGSEAHGVSEEVLKTADHIISIPHSEKIESLNVSIAGAILLWELNKS